MAHMISEFVVFEVIEWSGGFGPCVNNRAGIFRVRCNCGVDGCIRGGLLRMMHNGDGSILHGNPGGRSGGAISVGEISSSSGGEVFPSTSSEDRFVPVHVMATTAPASPSPPHLVLEDISDAEMDLPVDVSGYAPHSPDGGLRSPEWSSDSEEDEAEAAANPGAEGPVIADEDLVDLGVHPEAS